MDTVVGIVGLGYVGIPLAVEFGKIMTTIGFDKSREKIALFRQGIAPGDEIGGDQLREARHLSFTDDPALLSGADFILIAVPTLVNDAHQPEFEPLIQASSMAGKFMKKGAIIIFESTVYPGATEEVCIPVIESASGKKWKEDFHVGYSPERVNPGDKKHTLTQIIKIVSGDDPETLQKIAVLYESIIKAGVHRVSSIKVAEAAKVIENTQRDLNIALMNEVAIISHLVGIDAREVINAAATKWNFFPLRPGLVGGHCIGVVPYYLTYKAKKLGYHPDVILAGRRINNSMGKFIADQTIKQMIASGANIRDAKVNILGIAFKENIQDLSNSKVVDVVKELQSFGVEVFVHDPVVKSAEAKQRYGFSLVEWDELPVADALVVAVIHQQFLDKSLTELLTKVTVGGCFIDINSHFDAEYIRAKGVSVWRL
jgi:UDP-N-acetyl-D-glucosamine/UDP-N-acetyl-D-galactosamine dehydrogenase